MKADSDERVVGPEDAAAFFGPKTRACLNCFGAVISIGEDGKATATGTVVFVKIHGQKTIVTADHVVRGFNPRQRATILVVPTGDDGEPVARSAVHPVAFDIDLSDVMWSSQDFDVAPSMPVSLSGARMNLVARENAVETIDDLGLLQILESTRA